MAGVLNRLSKNLNDSMNQVQSDLQSNLISPLQRGISGASKSAPSDPQITDVNVNTATPATNILSSFPSVLSPITSHIPTAPMKPAPVPNAPPGAPPLPALPNDIPLPHPQTLLNTGKPFSDRLQIVLEESRDTFSAITRIFWLPLSWLLTLVHLVVKLLKDIMLLPFTIFVAIYERNIRARYPFLPSVWLITTLLFPSSIFPSFSSMEDIGKNLGIPKLPGMLGLSGLSRMPSMSVISPGILPRMPSMNGMPRTPGAFASSIPRFPSFTRAK